MWVVFVALMPLNRNGLGLVGVVTVCGSSFLTMSTLNGYALCVQLSREKNLEIINFFVMPEFYVKPLSHIEAHIFCVHLCVQYLTVKMSAFYLKHWVFNKRRAQVFTYSEL